MNQKDQTRKLPGFYIALCCCVIAIGAAGFIAQRMETKSTNVITEVEEPNVTQSAVLPPAVTTPAQSAMSQNTIVLDEADIPDEGSTTEAAAEEPEEEAAEDALAEDYTFDNPDFEVASVVVNAKDSELFTSPVPEGAILEGFSGDTLKYNTVFEDWRTHNGIDIEAAEGCSVSAAADGTVCDISEDSCGKQITIQHNNGYSTVYAQLNDINVSEGDEVKSGSVIGTVGASTGENTSKPHLHYEIRRDGIPLNPEEY